MNVVVIFHSSIFVLVVVISLLLKSVINPALVVISKPDIDTPLPSVTVLYSSPEILVISLLLASFIVSIISGYVEFAV